MFERFDLLFVSLHLLPQILYCILKLLVQQGVVTTGLATVALCIVCAALVNFSLVDWTLSLFEVFSIYLALH